MVPKLALLLALTTLLSPPLLEVPNTFNTKADIVSSPIIAPISKE